MRRKIPPIKGVCQLIPLFKERNAQRRKGIFRMGIISGYYLFLGAHATWGTHSSPHVQGDAFGRGESGIGSDHGIPLMLRI